MNQVPYPLEVPVA